MKSFRACCASVVLTLVLTTSAFAGEMHTGIAQTPPPPPPATLTFVPETTDGEAAGIEPFLVAALTLLRSVLPLF